MRSEHEQGTGITLATGRPRFVMRTPSTGRLSNSCKHCSRKSLTLNVFISEVYTILYISAKPLNLGKAECTRTANPRGVGGVRAGCGRQSYPIWSNSLDGAEGTELRGVAPIACFTHLWPKDDESFLSTVRTCFSPRHGSLLRGVIAAYE